MKNPNKITSKTSITVELFTDDKGEQSHYIKVNNGRMSPRTLLMAIGALLERLISFVW